MFSHAWDSAVSSHGYSQPSDRRRSSGDTRPRNVDPDGEGDTGNAVSTTDSTPRSSWRTTVNTNSREANHRSPLPRSTVTYWMSGPSRTVFSPVEPEVRVAFPVAGSTCPLKPLTSRVLPEERAVE